LSFWMPHENQSNPDWHTSVASTSMISWIISNR
jgi:hypothetical protein